MSAVVPLLIAEPGSVRAASPASWLKLTDCADLTRSISRLPAESAIRTSSWSLATARCSTRQVPREWR
jgi:hypothetical protein